MSSSKYTTPLNPDEIDFLMDYWEMRSPAEVVAWAMNLAYEFTKAESHGWTIAFHKGDVVGDQFKPTQSAQLPLAITLATNGAQAKIIQEDGTFTTG
jgi:hypothetical protein